MQFFGNYLVILKNCKNVFFVYFLSNFWIFTPGGPVRLNACQGSVANICTTEDVGHEFVSRLTFIMSREMFAVGLGTLFCRLLALWPFAAGGHWVPIPFLLSFYAWMKDEM